MTAFEEFSEGFEVAGVGFAGERAEAFFDAQVGHVLAEQAEIVRGFHASFDYGPGVGRIGRRRIGEEPHSTRNQTHYLKRLAGIGWVAGAALPVQED